MPFIIPVWIYYALAAAGTGAVAGGLAVKLSEDDKTTNHFNIDGQSIKDDDIAEFIKSTQPATTADGLVSIGEGIKYAAIAAGLVYTAVTIKRIL